MIVSEMLETVMLICFGLSWPISLVKNIKTGSAKGMSLPFTLLIIVGYVAGISAKLYSGVYSYVLLAYFWNLLLVGLNLAVFFVNKRKDKKDSHALSNAK